MRKNIFIIFSFLLLGFAACGDEQGFFVPGSNQPLPNPNPGGSAGSLIASNPPSGAIDARKPSEADGSNPQGWDRVELTFDGEPADITPQNFSVEVIGGPSDLAVMTVTSISSNKVRVVFNHAVAVGTWTRLIYNPSQTAIVLGYLPGDVNGDGYSGPQDILALIDAINGIRELSAWSGDLNRDGATSYPTDVLMLIDLLNGVEGYDAFLGATLPDLE